MLMLLAFCSCYWHSVHVTGILFMLLTFCYMLLAFCSFYWHSAHVTGILLMWLAFCSCYCTVRKMDLILSPIERRPQMQFSMARRFKLQLLRRYSIKFSKMCNFTFETLRLDKLKSTGGRWTNIPWIYSPWLYHCTTGTHVMKAEL